MAYEYHTGRVQLTDEHGLKTTKVLQIRIDDTIVTNALDRISKAIDAVSGWVDALDTIVDAVVTAVTLTHNITVASLDNSPGDQGVAEGANLVLSTVNPDGDVNLRPFWLPSAAAAIFNANFRTIATGDADLANFIDSFNPESGVKITISDGEEVQTVESGLYATRRRNSNA